LQCIVALELLVLKSATLHKFILVFKQMLRMLQVSLDIRIGDCIMQLLALIKVGVQRGILVH